MIGFRVRYLDSYHSTLPSIGKITYIGARAVSPFPLKQHSVRPPPGDTKIVFDVSIWDIRRPIRTRLRKCERWKNRERSTCNCKHHCVDFMTTIIVAILSVLLMNSYGGTDWSLTVQFKYEIQKVVAFKCRKW